MTLAERVSQAVFQAVREINKQLAVSAQVEESMDVVLFGSSGKLDSLGLVSLIVATEQKVEAEFSVTISLADERAMSQEENPFQTVRSLVEYISLLISEVDGEHEPGDGRYRDQ